MCLKHSCCLESLDCVLLMHLHFLKLLPFDPSQPKIYIQIWVSLGCACLSLVILKMFSLISFTSPFAYPIFFWQHIPAWPKIINSFKTLFLTLWEISCKFYMYCLHLAIRLGKTREQSYSSSFLMLAFLFFAWFTSRVGCFF